MTVYVYIQPSHRVKRENKKERRRNERQYTRTRMFLFFSGWQKDKRDLLFCFLFLRNNLQFHVSHLLIFAPLVYSACSPSISCSPHFLFPLLAWKRCSLTVRHKTKQPRTHKRDPFPIVWWWPSLYASFCVSFPFQNFSCFKRGGQDYKTLPRIQLSDVFLFEFGWNERKAHIYRLYTPLWKEGTKWKALWVLKRTSPISRWSAFTLHYPVIIIKFWVHMGRALIVKEPSAFRVCVYRLNVYIYIGYRWLGLAIIYGYL